MTQHFSIEQANALIPTLEDLLRKLQAHQAHMGTEYAELEDLKETTRTNGGHTRGISYLAEIASFASLIEDLHSHGCIVKDIHKGLIDFPTQKDGREVYLCWMLGEESVQWWHEREAGFAGRQSIETL